MRRLGFSRSDFFFLSLQLPSVSTRLETFQSLKFEGSRWQGSWGMGVRATGLLLFAISALFLSHCTLCLSLPSTGTFDRVVTLQVQEGICIRTYVIAKEKDFNALSDAKVLITSEYKSCESGEGVRLARETGWAPAESRNLRGSPGNFQGSLGNFWGTSALLLSSTVRGSQGISREVAREFPGRFGELPGKFRDFPEARGSLTPSPRLAKCVTNC